MQVFWKKGYTAASLADLTAAMQLNKSSLYNSFGDKHQLFKASLEAYGKLVERDYAAALKPMNTALENIGSIIDHIVAISIGRKNSCLGIKTSFELAAQDKEIKAVIRAGHDKTTALIKSLIVEAQASGDIKSNRDSEAMAHFVFNSFAGFRQSFIIYGNKKLVGSMACELKAFLRD